MHVACFISWLWSFIFLQGERGPPGVNGTQGFQGCPGQRGVKVSEFQENLTC